jgi:phosphoribosylformylglycinamidine synthase subunit PurQ / glutaminase
MKIGVVTFPGSNCEGDAVHAGRVMGHDVVRLWHKDTSLPQGLDAIILPGGFSYGDYLRTGAIARFSPVMAEVAKFAHAGGYVVGICNGFQILTEAGMLPGALIRNANLSFVCKDVHLRVENAETPYTNAYDRGAVLRIPVAHGEGRFIAADDVIRRIEDTGRVVFRYSTATGVIADDANPNGSINNIAGIVNDAGNVMGMMPHPERYVEAALGCADGRGVFESLAAHVERLAAHAVA